MGRSVFLVFLGLVLVVVVAVAAVLVLNPKDSGSGWVKVPRDVYEYDRLPGQEVVVKGLLDADDRVVVAIPEEGEPFLTTEEDVDRMADEGLLEGWDFRKPGWTHRIQLMDPEDLGIPPSYEDEAAFYLIVSSGTEAWKSEDLLDKYAGRIVELVGKWDCFTDPTYPRISITQFQPKSIKEADPR